MTKDNFYKLFKKAVDIENTIDDILKRNNQVINQAIFDYYDFNGNHTFYSLSTKSKYIRYFLNMSEFLTFVLDSKGISFKI